MTKKMVADLKPGEPVDDVFLLVGNELKSTRRDALYLDLEFMDRSGSITGRLWDATPEVYEAFAPDEFVRVKGTTEQYRGELQINVRMLSQPDAAKLRLRDFLPQSERDPKEMEAELREILSGVEDPDYRRLIDAFFADEQATSALRTAPAAVTNHHAYLGGLLEHTLSMAQVAAFVAEHYPDVRRDLLLTGVLFHDIGKVDELRYNRAFQYSSPGSLIGHLTLGAFYVRELAANLEDFPEEKLNHILHLILSHHGSREFGSPVLPMTPEAFALHFIDNLDAKLRTVSDVIKDDGNTHSDFTNYVRPLERRLYKK